MSGSAPFLYPIDASAETVGHGASEVRRWLRSAAFFRLDGLAHIRPLLKRGVHQ